MYSPCTQSGLLLLLLLLSLVEGKGGEEGQRGREDGTLEHAGIVVGRVTQRIRGQLLQCSRRCCRTGGTSQAGQLLGTACTTRGGLITTQQRRDGEEIRFLDAAAADADAAAVAAAAQQGVAAVRRDQQLGG